MTIEERQAEAKFLKHGDKKKIAQMAKVHITVVSKYLSGAFENSSVEPFFIAVVNKRKSQIDKQVADL